MDISDFTFSVEEIAHDLDMLVFRLETAQPEDKEELLRERARLRRELERLRDRLNDLASLSPRA
jgi:hypothetical protein